MPSRAAQVRVSVLSPVRFRGTSTALLEGSLQDHDEDDAEGDAGLKILNPESPRASPETACPHHGAAAARPAHALTEAESRGGVTSNSHCTLSKQSRNVVKPQ